MALIKTGLFAASYFSVEIARGKKYPRKLFAILPIIAIIDNLLILNEQKAEICKLDGDWWQINFVSVLSPVCIYCSKFGAVSWVQNFPSMSIW